MENNINFYRTLVGAAEQWPNQVAIIDAYGEVTYAALLSETAALQVKLIAAGVRAGAGVGIHIQNNRYFIISLYAVLGIGAIAMPIGHQQTTREIARAIREAKLHFVISENKAIALIEPVTSFADNKLTLFSTGRDPHVPTVDFIDSPAVMRFTSGTTGTSKCVVLSHQALWERTEAANEGLKLSAADRVLWVLPMAYHFVVSILLYVRYGIGIVVVDDFLAPVIIEKANSCAATVLYGAPLHIRLLAISREKILFQSLRKVISTTTGISTQICLAFYQRYGLPVMQAFGIIELGLPIMNTHFAAENPGAVGHPLPGFKITIVDENNQPLPFGKTGLLAIRGPGMFDGYLSPPIARADILKDGMFITGDYATQSEDGLVIILGRANGTIHVSGNKVFPNEVEEVLLQYPGVRQARVFGESHPWVGEVVVAELVANEQQPLDEEAVIRHCRNHLSLFKIPQRIRQVSHIKLTPTGKIRRT